MNKKGQVEAQFNWIFVLVVGGIILLFFTVIVMRQKTVSEQKLSATIISDLETIFTGASVSKGTTHLLEVPKVDLEFDCNRFYLGQVNKPIGKQVVFAPSRVKGTKLLTWTLEWNAPFKVTNFLYITSLEMRYIFIYDGLGEDLIKTINNTFPEEMNTEFYEYPLDFQDIKNKNNYKVRLIFIGKFGKPDIEEAIEGSDYFPSKLSKMDDNDVTALLITPSTTSEKYLHFYKKSGEEFEFRGDTVADSKSSSIDYISPEDLDENLPSLFGAIFADDYETYNCVMKKAFERLNLIATVYEDKADKSENHYRSQFRHVCESATGGASTDIRIIKSNSDECSTDFPKCSISTIANSASELNEQNNKLLLYSCALIY